MVDRKTLVSHLDEELDTGRYNAHEDAKENGDIVSGRDEVERVGLCTNFTWETIDAAQEQGCDLVISHHGGWEEFEGDLVEQKKNAIEEADMTWYVAHEPLDCADDYGVAATLARKLGIDVEGAFAEHAGGENGRYGSLAVSKQEFLERLAEIDDYDVVDGDDRDLADLDLEDARFAVIGGGGGVYMEFLKDALDHGCDVYITGNSTFYTDIYAYEQGLTLVTLEETSSEKWGVYALGDRLQQTFETLDVVRLDERNW